MTAEELIEELFIERNIAIIDRSLAELECSLGRNLTEEEEYEILDIVDDLTPTGEDGKYICALIPFDYAWQVYQTRQLRKFI